MEIKKLEVTIETLLKEFRSYREWSGHAINGIAHWIDHLIVLQKERDAQTQPLARNTSSSSNPAHGSAPNLAQSIVHRQSVDFIRYHEFGVFVYQNDQMYDVLPQQERGQDVREFVRNRPVGRSISADSDLLSAVFAYFCQQPDEILVVDIGGHWGLFSLDSVSRLRSFGRSAKIHCFEPGPTSRLISATVEINNLETEIEVHDRPVSDFSGYALFYSSEGFTNSNAMIKHMHHQFAELVKPIDAKEFFSSINVPKSIFIKLDTEGTEEIILRRIEDILMSRDVAMLIEFAYGPPSEQLVGFLNFLDRTHVILDVSTNLCIAADGFVDFVNKLIDMPGRWTDILCLPKSQPALCEIVMTLAAKFKAR